MPEDLKVLKGDAAEEYPDYLGACESLDQNLGKLVDKLKEKACMKIPLLSLERITVPILKQGTSTAI